jgi:hypothetical protein
MYGVRYELLVITFVPLVNKDQELWIARKVI